MSLKYINEAFKRLYESETENVEQGQFSELKEILLSVVDSLVNNNENHIKKFEIVLQDAIENYFPDQSWYEVTNINIFMDLFETRDPYKTIDNIIADIEANSVTAETIEDEFVEESLTEARNMDNVEINDIIAKSLSRKSFARKHEDELAKYGIKVDYLDGQGTSLIGPNGKRLSASRKEIFGPSTPGFSGTHYQGYIPKTSWAQRALDNATERLQKLENLVNTLDISELSSLYPNRSVEDAVELLKADFEKQKELVTDAVVRLKKETKDKEKGLSNRHATRKAGHERPYMDNNIEGDVSTSPIDYLTYLTKPVSELRKEKPYSDESGEHTPRINKYYALNDRIKSAERDLSWDKRYHKVLEPNEVQDEIDKLEAEFNKQVELLLNTQESNKKAISKSYDRVDKTKQDKADFLKSLGIGSN